MGLRALALVLLLGLALTTGACTHDEPAQAGPIRLGGLYPISGPESAVGQRMVRAAQLAVDEANAAGGALGRRVELVVGDDACDPASAVSAATATLARAIDVSVGGYCSSATLPVLKLFRDAGVPMIIPSANSTDLLSPGFDTVFLISPTTAVEGPVAIDAMRRTGARRVTIIDDATTYSTRLAEAAIERVNHPGSQLALAGRLALSQGESSYRRIADQVVAQKSDAAFFTGYYPEAAQLIRDLREAGFTGVIFLGDACVDPELLRSERLAGATTEGVFGVTPNVVPELVPGIDGWAARYRTAFGEAPGPNTMEAYDAVTLALDAIRRAGSTDRTAVRRAIAGTSALTLLTGPAGFNPDGTRRDPRIYVLQVRNNAFVLAPQG